MTSDQSHDAAEALSATLAHSESAPALFPGAGRGRRGYEPRAVDVFLARAREAFESPSTQDPGPAITSATVREASFPLVKRGYSITAVDAALSRIEDAFAARERDEEIARNGVESWVGKARITAQEVLDRLARPDGARFARARGLRYGYRVDEVDLIAGKLIGYLERGDAVTVEQVRQTAFRMQRRGYREEQVDALLDAVVEVMLAVG
ncbi:MAG: DivIVA domain-containing protein [Microbacterium sp.]